MKTISSSKTKTEIIEAYKRLAQELAEEQANNSKLQKELAEKQQIIHRAKEQTSNLQGEQITRLQNNIVQQLDQFKDQWNAQQQAFDEIQEAIEIEKANLEEIYQIKLQAETLDALIQTNKESKLKLDQEIQRKKQQLEDEIAGARLNWEREKEAYEYEQSVLKRNEENAYQERKAKLEKELQDKKIAFESSIGQREAAVKSQEDEFKSLKEQVDGFEHQLSTALEEAKRSTEERIRKQLDFEKQLELKDLQSELKLKEQMIKNLESKIEDQNNLILQLTRKADGASDQVKDIAVKAIEKSGYAASGRFSSFLDREFVKEQQEK